MAAALRSLWDLLCQEPVLREASAVGFLVFGSFISFWTNLAYFLGSPHYHLGAGVAGSFGLLGAGGAMMASPAGKLADRYGTRFTLTLGAWAVERGICAPLGFRVSPRRTDCGCDRARCRTADHADFQPDSHLRSFLHGAKPDQYRLHDHFLYGWRAGIGPFRHGVDPLAMERGLRLGAGDVGVGVATAWVWL